MAGTNIASDAMRVQISIEANDMNAISTLQSVNSAVQVLHKSNIDMQRLAIEAKFSPEAEREYELKKLIQLQDKLNLSTETYARLKADIQSSFVKASISAGTSTVPMQDQHILDYQAAQKEEQRINNAKIADQKRVEEEVARALDSQLSNYQRYYNRVVELDDKLAKGQMNNQQHGILVRAAREDYKALQDAEAKKAQLKQDAEDKRAETEKAAINKRQNAADAETRRLNLEVAKRNQAVKDADIERTQRIAKGVIDRQALEDKENNEARQKAESMMRAYQSPAQQAAAAQAFFNAQLANGTITANEHAEALEGIARRQRMMAGGAGNMGYVVGNLATGMEDFVTVLSMTGFGMDSFAAATRSASNNVGQAIRGMGTATAAMIAPLASIGMVLIGFAIPAIYKWAMGAEDAAEATKKFRQELDALRASATYASDIELLDLERLLTNKDIDKMFKNSFGKDQLTTTIEDKMEEVTNAIAEMQIKIKATAIGLDSDAGKIFDSVVHIDDSFNNLANGMGKALGPQVETHLRDRMAEIRQTFIDESKLIGGEDARQHLEANMKEFVKLVDSLRSEMTESQTMTFRLEAQGSNQLMMNDFTNEFLSILNDAAVIDRIQAAKEKVEELSKDKSEAARKEIEELNSLIMQLEKLKEAKAKAAAEEEKRTEHQSELQKLMFEKELKSMELQSKKNTLLGAENEAERKLLELAERRQQMLKEGAFLAPQAQIEGMFNAELEAIAADIETKLTKLQDISVQTDMQSQAEAYTNANRQIMGAAKEQKVEEKEMVELLTAIRNHLAGGAQLSVEIL